MRKYHYLMGMVLLGLATSCSEVMEEPGLNPNGDEITLRFEAPEALQVTRAVSGTNSGQGGLVNVDWSQYDLRYQVAVYTEDGSTLLSMKIIRLATVRKVSRLFKRQRLDTQVS